MITRASLLEFKKIWRQIYGVELSDDEAYNRAGVLLSLFRVVYANPNPEKGKNGHVPQKEIDKKIFTD